MRVAVIGGGPGGLYCARLFARGVRGAQVHVFERNPEGATFGFGVTLGDAALGHLAAADPEVVARLRERMVFDDLQLIRVRENDEPISYGRAGGSIARLVLLDVLTRACREVGVSIEFDRAVDSERHLADYDLVVVADGANSSSRAARGDAFGTETRTLTNRFAWFGVNRALAPNALVFRQAAGGRFVAHYYAYASDKSTFVAECDAQTWTAAGLDRMSDAARRGLIEAVFARELDGAPLVENRSIWRQFAAVTNARWYNGNLVLIGDALRSAHFSIGSGTRLAMEDAQALFQAFADATNVSEALPLYVERRRPVRDRFGEAAERSFDWYERLAEVMQQEPLAFAYDFLTRTGRVDAARLASYAPAFARRYRDAAPALAS